MNTYVARIVQRKAERCLRGHISDQEIRFALLFFGFVQQKALSLLPLKWKQKARS